MNKTPTTLIIMDGFGLSNDTVGNAVRAANTPVLDGLFAEYAHTTLQASGLDVGLPAGQMGNSEVGHTNIGGGRVVFQDLPRITRSIEDGTFFENPAYNKAMDDCIEKGSALHLYGLHSTGGVHSTLDHLYALLKMAHIKGLKRVYIHAFLDGRDTPPTSGRDFVAKTMEKCRELGVGKIATVMGRYYAMDRDKRWDRLENAYDALVYGEGVQDPDPIHAIEESYKNGVTDEFVEPIVCDKDGMISDNDSVIFFNYRPDRAREITRAFVDPAFDGFKREFFPLTYVCNTEYDATMPNVLVAFPRISVKNGLGEYLSKMGMTQLRIAETEKYAHVTFFFNGGVEDPYPGDGPRTRRVPEGRDLRPPARDERLRGREQVRRAHRVRQVRRHHSELCQLRHGRPHGRVRRRRQGRRNGRRVRRSGRGGDAQDGRHRDDHRRPRQRRADAPSRRQEPDDRAHDECGALHPLRRRYRAAPRPPRRHRADDPRCDGP